MTLQIEIDGRLSRVLVERAGSEPRYRFTIDGQSADVDAVRLDRWTWSLILPDGSQHVVAVRGSAMSGFTVHLSSRDVTAGVARRGHRTSRPLGGGQEGIGSGPARIMAPMPGKVVRVLVTVGQNVQAGEGIVVVEAMKMENELRAPRAGVVREIAARPGLSVEVGAVLAVVD
ncbi:MAG TPA: biotin/lipoyl-containing protein [Vicinamibacterales bacterium]|jgi:biotin carboxyl carrier protein